MKQNEGDLDGRQQQVKGYKDRKATEAMAAELEKRRTAWG
jgi:hypothetical protein